MKQTLIIFSLLQISLVFTQSPELQNMRHSSIWDREPCNAQEKATIFAHDCFAQKSETTKNTGQIA